MADTPWPSVKEWVALNKKHNLWGDQPFRRDMISESDFARPGHASKLFGVYTAKLGEFFGRLIAATTPVNPKPKRKAILHPLPADSDSDEFPDPPPERSRPLVSREEWLEVEAKMKGEWSAFDLALHTLKNAGKGQEGYWSALTQSTKYVTWINGLGQALPTRW